MPNTTDKKKIVLAEESKTLRKLIGAALKSADYEVIEFEDGINALNYSLKNKPDCIISNVMLPKVDGFQLTSIIKDGADFTGVPVILFSPEDDVQDFWTATSGADRIISLSPDKIEDLISILHDVFFVGKIEAEIFTANSREKSLASEENASTLCAIKAMEKNHFFFNMQNAAFELFNYIEDFDQLIKKIFGIIYELCGYDVAALILNDGTGAVYTAGVEKLDFDDTKAFMKICTSDFEMNVSDTFAVLYENHILADIVKNPKEHADFTSYNCFVFAQDDSVLGTLHLASSKKNCFNYKIKSAIQYFTEHIYQILKNAVNFRNINQSEIRMRQTFSKFVPEEIIDDLLKSEASEKQSANEKRKVAVLICDIRNFTSISEINQPENVVSFLNEYFTQMVDVIKKYGGSIDKFMGDAIMALFGAPISYVDNAERAVKAALEMTELISSIPCSLLKFPDGIKLDCGIGIHYGEAIVGNIGCKDKTDYTVIGDTVNLASRLEGLTKLYGSRVIVSQSVKDELTEGINLLHVDNVRVKGKSQGVEIYRAENKALPVDYSINYEKGLNLYLNGAWTLALSYFEKCLQVIPNEKSAKLMVERCKEFAANHPENWNGAVALTSK